MCSEWNEALDRMLEIQREGVVSRSFAYMSNGKMEYDCFDTDEIQYEQQGPL